MGVQSRYIGIGTSQRGTSVSARYKAHSFRARKEVRGDRPDRSEFSGLREQCVARRCLVQVCTFWTSDYAMKDNDGVRSNSAV